MKLRTDEELVAIVSGPAEDWEPDAMEAAHRELETRDIPAPERKDLAQKAERAAKASERGLTSGGKVLSFFAGTSVIGFVLGPIYYLQFKKAGEHRKANELLQYAGYGLILTIVAIGLRGGCR